MKYKIKTFKEIKHIVEECKKYNKIISTTNGAFDLFHVGHLDSLQQAAQLSDILIVGVNSDASIKRYKSSHRPIIPQQQRALILAAIEYVDFVVIFDEKTPVKLLKIIKPDYHIKGVEYKNKLPEKNVVERNGGKIVFINRKLKISTTNIIRRCKNEGKKE